MLFDATIATDGTVREVKTVQSPNAELAAAEGRDQAAEVRFEKADARRHQRLERKVRRIARRLDDPDFVAEHPLLAENAAAPEPQAQS